jgi:uncharacterized protein YkwD
MGGDVSVAALGIAAVTTTLRHPTPPFMNTTRLARVARGILYAMHMNGNMSSENLQWVADSSMCAR